MVANATIKYFVASATNMGDNPGYNSSIGHHVFVLTKYQRKYMDLQLEPFGLGGKDFPFLSVLYHQDGRTQEEITEHVGVDKATTARAVTRLVEKGFVTKEVDPTDHRAYRVYLTKKGKDFQPKLRKILKSWTEKMLSNLSKKESDELFKLLGKLVDVVEEIK